MKKQIPILLAACVIVMAIVVFPQLTPRLTSSAHNLNASTMSGAKPDLIVDQAILRQHWVVRVEDFPAEFCSVQEGGITPGTHAVVRFTVSTPNIGDADLIVGDPNAHVAANDGLFEFASCHHHFHFRHYALYELVNPTTGQVWRAAKRGFCMIDFDKYGAYPGPNNNERKYLDCGAPGEPGNQGISKGWADTYVWKLAGQFFLLDGGDGQPPVPPGDYVIRITVNPGFIPSPDEPSTFASPDPLHPGVFHQLLESDYENNVAQVTITIPTHPGRQGVGPLKNQPAITEEIID
ncbi:MAG TPA: lysyl oxidase family protein [Blastocatellia bacterium]|nr:lysyl oxidase family protein [Blastocatellia bacterium]